MTSFNSDEYIALGNVFPLVYVSYTQHQRPFVVRLNAQQAMVLGINRNLYFDTSVQLINFYQDHMARFGYCLPKVCQIKAGDHSDKLPVRISQSVVKKNLQEIAEILEYKKSYVDVNDHALSNNHFNLQLHSGVT